MSMLDRLKADQLAARKDRDAVRAALLTTVISEASYVSEQDFKAGRTQTTDEKVVRTVKSFMGNIEKALNGYVDEATGAKIPPVTDPTARAKYEAERGILLPYIPSELSETELRAEVALLAADNAGPFTLKDTKTVKSSLEAKFPGRVNGKLLVDIIKNQQAA